MTDATDQQRVVDLGEQYKPTPRQSKAHGVTETNVLFGGAIGGGKTIWLVNEAIQLSLDYPGNRGYLCRHELTSLRRSTLLELIRFLPGELVEQHHQTENYFKLKNGSLIFYGGLGDDKGGVDRLKSMTLGWFGIDQAEETSESHFNMLSGRLRLVIPGQSMHYKALLTANPAPGWVKNLFIEQVKEDFVFIPSLPRDNPYLPKDYEAKLRKIYPKELIAALLDGDWNALEGGNFLFRYADIRRAITAELPEGEPLMMGVDIAREGSDESVAVVRAGACVIHLEAWGKADLMQTTGKVGRLMEQFNLNDKYVNLDAVGVGAGVYDRLREQKHYVNAVIAGGEPDDKEHHINTRAEMYAQLQRRFEAGEISIPDDLDLTAQLSSIRYKIASDKKLQIVSKEDMKRVYRLKSPDKADALALAYYEPKQHKPAIRWL